MIDSRDLNELAPVVKRGAVELFRRLNAIGYSVIATSTYRDYETQDYLYEQGRTRPGAIVTNAKGGYSNHNFRLAFDICKNIKGQEFSDGAFFNKAGAVWREMGGTWGGDFTSLVDKPHMEFTNGLTTAQLRTGAKLPENTLMKWEAAPIESANAELIKKLGVHIEIDPNYWVGVLDGKTALNPQYLLILIERIAAKAPENTKLRADYAVSRLAGIVNLDHNYWAPAARGERAVDPSYLKTLFERVADAL